MLPQAPSDLLREVGEGSLELIDVGRVLVESVFVADGLGVAMLADVAVEPAAGILAFRLAGQRQTPFAELLLEHALVQRGQISDTLEDRKSTRLNSSHLG